MTAQVPEKLILDGKETSLMFCPPLPKNDARLVRLTRSEIEQSDPPPIIFSTACWRNYIATWEIKDDQFFLVDITGSYRLESPEPILANWFSGVLRIPRGEILQYVHMGFGSVYEQELHIKIIKGQITTSRLINNQDKSIDAFELSRRNLPGLENRFDGDDEL